MSLFCQTFPPSLSAVICIIFIHITLDILFLFHVSMISLVMHPISRSHALLKRLIILNTWSFHLNQLLFTTSTRVSSIPNFHSSWLEMINMFKKIWFGLYSNLPFSFYFYFNSIHFSSNYLFILDFLWSQECRWRFQWNILFILKLYFECLEHYFYQFEILFNKRTIWSIVS